MGKEKRKQHRANQAVLNSARVSPFKVRPVADLIRHKGIDEALTILQFTQKKAAPMLTKLIESALSNIETSNELDWDIDELVVSQLTVDEGPTLRRFQPRAQGRAFRINKRTCHIKVVLTPRT